MTDDTTRDAGATASADDTGAATAADTGTDTTTATAAPAAATAAPASPSARGTDAARPPFSVKFSARDLLSVAIFGVIYFVVVYAIAMLGIIGPLAMLLTLPLAIVAAGIPYMLFLTRVKHAGMVTLFGLVVGAVYLVSGQPLISFLLTIVVSLVAEVVLWLGRYCSRWAAIWTYAVYSLWFIGPLLPLVINRQEYLASQGMSVMGPEYVAAFDQLFSLTVVWIYNVSTLVFGFLGGLLGSAILRKHFVRAGLA